MTLYSDLNYTNYQKGNKVEDIDSVYQSIFTILSTRKRSRVFKPEFGSLLDSYLEEPCDNATAFQILSDIINTLRQDPRVILNMQNTFVTPIPSEKKFVISLDFSILGFESYNNKTINLSLGK